MLKMRNIIFKTTIFIPNLMSRNLERLDRCELECFMRLRELRTPTRVAIEHASITMKGKIDELNKSETSKKVERVGDDSSQYVLDKLVELSNWVESWKSENI